MNGRRNAGNRTLLLTAAGFGVWSAAFVTLYGMLSVGCAVGWQQVELLPGLSAQRLQVVVLALAFTIAQIAVAWRLRGPTSNPVANPPVQFLRSVACIGAFCALGASIFTFAGVFLLSPCV